MDDEGMYRSPDRGEGAKTVDEQEENPKSALVSASFFGGSVKEGDEKRVRVVKHYGDSIEIVSLEPEKQREAGAGGSQPPLPADDELAGMDTGE
jgi:hypothetical protein